MEKDAPDRVREALVEQGRHKASKARERTLQQQAYVIWLGRAPGGLTRYEIPYGTNGKTHRDAGAS